MKRLDVAQYVKDNFSNAEDTGFTNSGYQTREQFIDRILANIKNDLSEGNFNLAVYPDGLAARNIVNELYSGMVLIGERDIEDSWHKR